MIFYLLEMNPGNWESILVKEEPLDHDYHLDKSYRDEEACDPLEIKNVESNRNYPELNSPLLQPIIKKETIVPEQKKPQLRLNSTSGEQRTSVEINSFILGNCGIVEEPLGDDYALEKFSSRQETRDLFEEEDVKYVPKLCSSLHQPIIKEKTEVPKFIKRLITLPSTSGEQRSTVQLEIEVESGDIEISDFQRINCNGKKVWYAQPRETIDEREIVDALRKVSPTLVKSSQAKQKTLRTGAENRVSSSCFTKKRPFKCNFCDRLFTKKSSITKHRMIHTGEKPHQCVICRRAFRLVSRLRSHMLIHSDVKPFNCDVCKAAFSRKEYLKVHMTIHIGEKPHECGICKKAFSIKGQLTVHMATHCGKKPHECIICRKAFLKMSYLRAHMVIHNTEKSHACGICRKVFTQKYDLKRHMLIHRGEKPHKCYVCKKAFSKIIYLEKHMSTHT